jgi:hypothetical protein
LLMNWCDACYRSDFDFRLTLSKISIMRKMAFYSLLSVVSVFLFLTSCQKDDNSNDDNPNVVVQSGKWKVTYYFDDKDETSDLSGHVFEFKSGNLLTSTKGSNVYNGTWSTTDDDSSKKLVINFSSPDELVEISDDWKIIEMTDAKIRLEDVSGGDGSVEYLTFEKI